MRLGRANIEVDTADSGYLFGIWHPGYVLSFSLVFGFWKWRLRIDIARKENSECIE